MKNQFAILEELLGINLDIKFGFIQDIEFCDIKIEKSFLNDQISRLRIQKILSDFMLILGYCISLIYILFAFKRDIFFFSFLFFFALSLIILFFSYHSENKTLLSYFDHLQIFFISLNLNVKAFIIILFYNDPKVDHMYDNNAEELLRVIIYNFITSNFLLLVKLEGKLLVHIFYLMMNLITIAICQIFCQNDHYFYLEGVVSILFTLIFYLFRKIWEYNLRLNYSEKYKFENLFVYTNDFIQGLNGYHLNFSKDLLLYYDKKFFNLLNENLVLNSKTSELSEFKNHPDKSTIKEIEKDSIEIEKKSILKNKNSKLKITNEEINSLKEKSILVNIVENLNEKNLINQKTNLKEENSEFIQSHQNFLTIDNLNQSIRKSPAQKKTEKREYKDNLFRKVTKNFLNLPKYPNREKINLDYKKNPIDENNPITFFLKELRKYSIIENDKPNKEIVEKNININKIENSLETNNMLSCLNRNKIDENLMFYINQDRKTPVTTKLEISNDINEPDFNLLDKIKSIINEEKENYILNENRNIYFGIYHFNLDNKKLEEFNANYKNYFTQDPKIDKEKYSGDIEEKSNIIDRSLGKCELNHISTSNMLNININFNNNSIFSNEKNLIKKDEINSFMRKPIKNGMENRRNSTEINNSSLNNDNQIKIENNNLNKLINKINFQNILKKEENSSNYNIKKGKTYFPSKEKFENLENKITNKKKFSKTTLDYKKSFANKKSLKEFTINSQEKKEKSVKNKNKFFDVYYRRIYFSEEKVIYNIIFYDITDLMYARIKINEENKKKHKMLAKIAHEFKTPLTSIISLISIIQDTLCADSENFNNDTIDLSSKNKKKNKETIDTLNLIKNLSRYVIFLTSDIIHYSNPNNINDIKLSDQIINFKEISTFCYDILTCLLYCNISKLKKIKSELIYDDLLEKVEIFSDEVRIKQILLNFISNSVKFTNEGFIKLSFQVMKEGNEEYIKLSVEDSGIGIKEKEKLLLFRDFQKLDNNNSINNINNFGSGLGLSICKNLAEKLKMIIYFDSDYGKGTRIFLKIPLQNKNEKKIYELKENIHLIDDIEVDEISNDLQKLINNHIDYKNTDEKKKQVTESVVIYDNFYKNKLKDLSFTNNVSTINKNLHFKTDINFLNFEKSKDSYQVKTDTQKKKFDIQVVNNQAKKTLKRSKFDIKISKADIDNDTKFKSFSSRKILDASIYKKNDSVNSCSNSINSKHREFSLFKRYYPNNSLISKIDHFSHNLKINLYEDDDVSTVLNDMSKILFTKDDIFNFQMPKIIPNRKNKLKFSNTYKSSLPIPLGTCRSLSETHSAVLNINFENIQKKIIIVADDNHIINDSNKRIISSICKDRDLDYEILTCADGMDILKYIIDDKMFHNIKIIITDENMEFLNGSEAIKVIRTIEARKKNFKKLIISLTCHEDSTILNYIRESGADIVITKPLSKNKIENIFDLDFFYEFENKI